MFKNKLLSFVLISVKWKVKVRWLSHVRLFATPWTVAYQASQSMGFSRQEYQSGLPFPSPGDFPDPGIEPGSPALQADALPSEPPGKPFYMCAFSYVAGNLEQDEDSSSTMETVHWTSMPKFKTLKNKIIRKRDPWEPEEGSLDLLGNSMYSQQTVLVSEQEMELSLQYPLWHSFLVPSNTLNAFL